MLRYLLVSIALAALAEFASIIWVGEHLGLIATLGLMILSGMAGMAVIRSGGAGLVATLRQPPRDFHFASREAASRFLVMLAGVLLIVPGFVSDVVALALLLPPLRLLLAARLASKVKVHATAWREPPKAGPLVIEGEAREIEPGPPRDI